MTRKTDDPTTCLEREYLDKVAQACLPERVLARVVLQKMAALGADTSGCHDILVRALAERMTNEPDVSSITVKTGDSRIDELDLRIDLGELDLDQVVQEITEGVEASLPALLETLRQTCLDSVLDKPDARLLDLANAQSAFESRLRLTWHKPLTLLGIYLAVVYELGEAWGKKLQRSRAKDRDVIDVILRLHARTVQVAAEVRTLLQSGFADGALSRWRTIHELVVIALFIAREGSEVARRYLEHLDVDSYKAAQQYQQAAPLLGYKPVPPRELASLTKRVDALKKRYGKEFAGEYGWAAGALNGRSANFAVIEEAVNLHRFRPYFRLASNTVHAGPKGAFFRLGIIGPDLLLAGASNAGLDEAARLTALSLAQITSCLLNLRPTLDSGVWSGVLIDLAQMIEAEAVKVQRGIERKERRLLQAGKPAAKKRVRANDAS